MLRFRGRGRGHRYRQGRGDRYRRGQGRGLLRVGTANREGRQSAEEANESHGRENFLHVKLPFLLMH